MPKAKSSKDQAPSFTYLIEKKREGGEFTDEEIRSIVDAILDEEMPEFQQAAWVMATFFQGMSAQEIAYFTEELMLSGEKIKAARAVEVGLLNYVVPPAQIDGKVAELVGKLVRKMGCSRSCVVDLRKHSTEQNQF